MTHLFYPVDHLDHVYGPQGAAITLVEYGDFQCPYCGEMYRVIKELQEKMGDQMRFVFRHFPLANMHRHALHAAEFAEAAAKSEKFWDAHDMLFENQAELEDENLLRYALALGLSGNDVVLAFEGKYDHVIQKDFDGGMRSGVEGTPMLFINGNRYEGPSDAQVIAGAMHAAMRGA